MSNSSSAVKMMHAVHYDAYGGELKVWSINLFSFVLCVCIIILLELYINPVAIACN